MTDRKGWDLALLMAATLWLGMLLGVSGLATPVKFRAPSLSLPVALDVGRHTFAVFTKVEWLLAGLLIVATWRGRLGLGIWAVSAAVTTLLLVETNILLPALDQRVEMIIRGAIPEPSSLHLLYVAAESAKAVLLGMTAAIVLWRLSIHQDRPAATDPSGDKVSPIDCSGLERRLR